MNSGSIGIIGGADGPTAIFLASGLPLVTVAIIAGVIILTVFLFIKHR